VTVVPTARAQAGRAASRRGGEVRHYRPERTHSNFKQEKRWPVLNAHDVPFSEVTVHPGTLEQGYME